MKTKPLLICTLLFSLTTGADVWAHEVQPAIVDFVFATDGNYRIKIRTNLEAMIADIGAEHEDTDDSKNVSQYNLLRKLPPDLLEQQLGVFVPRLLSGISLIVDGTRQDLIHDGVEIPAIGDLELARESKIHLKGSFPDGAKNVTWQWKPSFGANALRVSAPGAPELYSAYLKDGKQSKPIRIANGRVKAPAQYSFWSEFFDYIGVGFAHILPWGLDHILFIVGLFLLNARIRPLLVQITSFTLAHSATLALGILGVVEISPSIVEPLIAASIIYVCVENIFSETLSRGRPVVVFGFGLLHGLGFASVLKDFGISSSHFISGLVAFNIGVELGQLTIIAVCFLAVGVWFRDKPWYRDRITIPASVIVAAIGAYWLIERTVL